MTASETAVVPAPPLRGAIPWVLGSLVLTTAALIGQVPLWVLGVFTACAAWRQVLEQRHRRMPSLPVRMAIFVSAAVGVIFTYGSHLGAPGMLSFLVALLSLKVLEMRTARDLTVVALLGYFMVLSAFFYNQSLAISAYLSVAILANTVALIQCHGSGGVRRGWSAVRLAFLLAAQALPLVFLFFVVFPRVQGEWLRRLGGVSTGLTGMSEHLEPGSFSSLVQSGATAFNVQIDNSNGALPARSLYWRGLVLDLCDRGLSWRASESVPIYGPPKPAPPGSVRIKQTITLWPQGAHWLFALDRPIESARTASVRPQLMFTNVLYNREPIIAKTTYTVVSQLGPMPASISNGARLALTRVPPDLSPRVRDLANQWRQQAHSPDDIIRFANAFFRDNGFTYTLSPGALPPKTALETFLFKTRRGFCEHYAAAFCTLVRAAGLPARIVVGYQGGEFNSWGGYYTVRQSDAHAWAEVWLDGRGWQREDPTAVVAPERLSFGAESYAELASDGPLSEQARLERLTRLASHGGLRWLFHNAFLAWDSVDQQWNLLVLGYDQEKQSAVFERLGVNGLDTFVGTALTVATVGIVLGLFAFGLRTLTRETVGAGGDRARRLYLRFCRKLSAAGGVERAPAEGPLAFSARASGALPHESDAIAKITELYVELRYAPGDGDREGILADLRRAVRAFRPAPAREE